MDQPVGQKSKTRTFKVLRENGKVHIEEKKNNINSIASEFFPPFVVSASTPAEPKKRVFKVASSTVASSEVPAAVLASVVPAHAKEEEAFEEVKNLEEGVPLERKDEKLEELRTGENELKPNLDSILVTYIYDLSELLNNSLNINDINCLKRYQNLVIANKNIIEIVKNYNQYGEYICQDVNILKKMLLQL